MKQLEQIKDKLETTRRDTVVVKTRTLLKLVSALMEAKGQIRDLELRELFSRRRKS
jgi:hypothetical protein